MTYEGFPQSKTWKYPDLWAAALDRISEAALPEVRSGLARSRVLITGFGTAAYAAAAISSAWPRATTASTSDILLNTEQYIHDIDVVISIDGLGSSPECPAVVERIHQLRPGIAHWGITCDPYGSLVKLPFVRSIILDPRTPNGDRTTGGSFSCLVLGGISVVDQNAVKSAVQKASVDAGAKLNAIDRVIRAVAQRVRGHVLLLASYPLFAWAQMGAEQILEMTSGEFPVSAETYLRMRHGPADLLLSGTTLLCLLSNEPDRRHYEEGLIRELRAKNPGYFVGISVTQPPTNLFDVTTTPIGADIEDAFRASFEIIAPELLGHHLSSRAGPGRNRQGTYPAIDRVVQRAPIYEHPPGPFR